MGKVEVSRTELVWPGKYKEDGTLKEVPRVALPFQIIETVNESRATREAKKDGEQGTLFDVYQGKEGETFEAGWRNKLVWGDNLLVMGSLLEKFAGKIDLIYIDPPFATGADFSFVTHVGEGGTEITKEQSVIEEKAYRDTWGQGNGSYLDMLHQRLTVLKDLLSPVGSVYVHLDWHLVHFVRALLDEIFGAENFINEIIRVKSNPKNFPQPQYGNYHDTILFYAIDRGNKIWDPPKQAVSKEQLKVDFPFTDKKGRRYKTDPLHAPGVRYGLTGEKWKGLAPPPGRHWAYVPKALDEFDAKGQIEWSSKGNPRLKTYAEENEGYPYQDIWTDFKDPVRKDYATEKNEALLDLIVRSSSRKGSLVADFFCGSGTTLAAAENLGRRWIGCDLGRWAINISRKRLLGVEDCKPFEVLNLGRYERQYWQGVTFGEKDSALLTEQAFYEYLAFILRLYGAQPVAGMAQVHGKKGKAMVHVGAVDAPITISEIDAALQEVAKLKQGELHVLGWDWEMGLYDLMVDAAKKKGVKLLLLQIPREVMETQAAAKGDVRFFELAYLEAEIRRPKKLTAQIALKDFVIPNTELIPEDVRTKIKKWSDYIDYWAIDWDFRDDTFMQGWVTYRTREERKLALVSDPHTYNGSGDYRVLVKVIDVFGNDTSQVFDVEAK